MNTEPLLSGAKQPHTATTGFFHADSFPGLVLIETSEGDLIQARVCISLTKPKPEHRPGLRINMEEMKEGITMASGEIDRMAKAIKNILPEREAELVKRFREIADKYFETRGVQFFPSERDRSSLAEFIREEAETMADTWRADRRRRERERECELLDFIRSAMPVGTIPPNDQAGLSEAVRIMARYIVRGLPAEVEQLQKLTAENANLKSRVEGLESIIEERERKLKETRQERDRAKTAVWNSALAANVVAKKYGSTVRATTDGEGLQSAIYELGAHLERQDTKLRESHIDRQAIIDRLTKEAAEKEAELEAKFEEFCEYKGTVIPGIEGAPDFMDYLIAQIREAKSATPAASAPAPDRSAELAAADNLARSLRTRLTAAEEKAKRLEQWASVVANALKSAGIVGIDGTAVEVVRQVSIAVAEFQGLKERCKMAEQARDRLMSVPSNYQNTKELRQLRRLNGKIARRLTACRADRRKLREFIKTTILEPGVLPLPLSIMQKQARELVK